jgi:small subunit ribosomal protein S13
MRILGITIPDTKRLEIGLTSLYGIGRARAQKILTEADIPFGKRPTELSPAEESRLRVLFEKYRLEGDLRREVSGNIKRLKDIKAYRGTRHMRRLPARGQRTKANCRSNKNCNS